MNHPNCWLTGRQAADNSTIESPQCELALRAALRHFASCSMKALPKRSKSMLRVQCSISSSGMSALDLGSGAVMVSSS